MLPLFTIGYVGARRGEKKSHYNDDDLLPYHILSACGLIAAYTHRRNKGGFNLASQDEVVVDIRQVWMFL